MVIMGDDFIASGRQGSADYVGNNLLATHGAHDVLTGTDGADTFTVSPDEGQTQIVDFTSGSDTIDLSQLPSGAKVEMISMFGRTIILVASSDLPHGVMEISVQGQVASSDLVLPADARLKDFGHLGGHPGGTPELVADTHFADMVHWNPATLFPDHAHGDFFFG